MGEDWETAFFNAHGYAPTDADRQARLYSVIFAGHVSGQRDWTDDDWAYFSEDRVRLFMRDTTGRESLADFADEIQRLSNTYSPGEQEQFVWAIALLYAGVPYGTRLGGVVQQGLGGARVQVPECANANIRCGWLTHGMVGFSSQVTDGAENTHHYAGQLLAGYYLWREVADTASRARELAQGTSVDGRFPFVHVEPDSLDINMGDIAVRHGRWLATGALPLWDLPDLLLRDLQ